MTRDFSKLVPLALLLFMVLNDVECLPHRSYSGLENPATSASYLDLNDETQSSERGYASRKILSTGNWALNDDGVPSRLDGKIIFPSDDVNLQPSRPPFIPNLKPTCQNSTFCEHSENYPNDFVEAALRMNKDINLFSGSDLVPEVVHRVNAPAPEDVPLCESFEQVVYPKVARSKDNDWLFVVNHGNFTQGVRVETCGTEGSMCSVIDGFALGYQTTCKQKYIYRQLMAVLPTGEIKGQSFKFPASCCCHIKFTGNSELRIGVSPTVRIAESHGKVSGLRLGVSPTMKIKESSSKVPRKK